MATRRALGRGLSALLSDAPEMVSEPSENLLVRQREQLLSVDVDLIDRNPEQPRTKFNEEKLEELAQSIKANGVVQPILLRKAVNGRYQIIAGERRWRAAQKAGLHKISAVIRETSDSELLELALIENIQRQELNPIEEAMAYQKLIDTFGLTQDEMARRVGKDRSSIANHLRLLKLSSKVQKLLEDEAISMGHARALLRIDKAETQEKLANQIVTRKLSVREVESLVKKLAVGGAIKGVSTPVRNDANIRAAELKLKKQLGAQVNIQIGRRGGKIEILFSSMDELNRVYSIVMRKAEPLMASPSDTE